MPDDTEVVIDEWPWLPPFIEIEGQSEDAVRAAATALVLTGKTPCLVLSHKPIANTTQAFQTISSWTTC